MGASTCKCGNLALLPAATCEMCRLKAENAALREENRKLRDAWPRYENQCVMYCDTSKKWFTLTDGRVFDTRDAAINVAAGIKQAADTACLIAVPDGPRFYTLYWSSESVGNQTYENLQTVANRYGVTIPLADRRA